MSKVIILTERNNQLNNEENKRLLFKCRLDISSSHRKNLASLSINNSQMHIKKKPLYTKEQKYSKKEKLNPYSHKKNIAYSNRNNNIFKEGRNANTKNFNSTFINFAKNIKHDIINNNRKKGNNKNYNSNKTFINKSLNNSIVGKPILAGKQIKNNVLNKMKKKKEQHRAKKKILSLSNSLTKSNKNKKKDININKKEYVDKFFNKNNSTIKDNKNNNTIKSGNPIKFSLKAHKNNKENKSITKRINHSYNLFGNIKFRKYEDNTKKVKENINNKKLKLKKMNLITKDSKNKKGKYNKESMDNSKLFRNNFQLSCKIINKTDINSANNENQKYSKNQYLIRRNLYNNNKLNDEINNEFNEKEIKVNKLEDIYYLSEKSNKIINCDSEKIQKEEEEEEDSNILSLDDVQDIIKYYSFNGINKYNNYLFYKNDYKNYINNNKYNIIKEFFEGTESLNLIKYEKIEKNSNKKNYDNRNVNIYYKNIGIYSPINIINFEKNIYKTNKK